MQRRNLDKKTADAAAAEGKTAEGLQLLDAHCDGTFGELNEVVLLAG